LLKLHQPEDMNEALIGADEETRTLTPRGAGT
jgi:hypothetical protein